MNKREKQEQSRLPPCPNPDCRQSHVVCSGSHRGRQRLDYWRLGFNRRSFAMLAGLAAPRTQRLRPEPLSCPARFPFTFGLEASSVTLGISPIPADIRLYCAPLHGAPDGPSSHYRVIEAN